MNPSDLKVSGGMADWEGEMKKKKNWSGGRVN